ncbi:MAG TPA: hypothetical protein VLI72_09660 [Methylibium sp.]|nr:hypothetical protein [Methylibium sp.]
MGSLDAATPWRLLPALALGWLAFSFGRTLRRGCVPLIERIARVGDPALEPALCLYTRRLTQCWCAYLAAGALLSLVMPMAGLWTGVGSALLFVGERGLRPRFFPGRRFPGLSQQLRDAVSVWRGGA